MLTGLQPGHVGQLNWRVGPQQTIHLGADAPGGRGAVVFSTPAMVNLMEHAAREALRAYLEPGEESVGVTVEVQHLAATPIAAEVRAEARVTNVDGRLIDFDIAAFDAAEQIGRGTHRRAVIRLDKMRGKLEEKTASLPQGVLLPMSITPNTGPLPSLPTLLVDIDGPVRTVTLNRPNKLNAVDTQMTADIESLVGWLAGHPEVRVVILTGAGRAFCAGDDVKEVGALDIDVATELSLRQARMYLAFEQLPQVIIAAVNGPALGGGCVAAYHCDVRVASLNAVFGMPELLLGWPPGYGVAQLTALVGKARALELCLTGKQINARTALEWGLINDAVPQQQLMPTVHKLAETLLATPPVALRETKRLIHDDEGVQPKVTHVADTAAYIDCLKTADAREGIAAFVEKRSPRFTGR